MKQQTVIFFDGVCNLCNGFVRFVFKRDRKELFQFQSLQSSKATEVLAEYNYTIGTDLKSFVLIHNGKLYTKSSAALKVFQLLGFPYALTSVFYIVPTFIRNAVYSFIAKNRYKWFGKQKEVCEYNPDFRKRVL